MDEYVLIIHHAGRHGKHSFAAEGGEENVHGWADKEAGTAGVWA
jgi:hypothetical protein